MKTVAYYTSLALFIIMNGVSAQSEWENLLDKNLSNWDKFIGVPHTSLDLAGYEKGDGMHGTPIGLNNDPLDVFSTFDEEGQTILHVSGEIYGGLSTKENYENYHFSAEFKWGEHKYEPRLDRKRDNGILYHCQEPHGQFWNVWMRAPEMQIQEADFGDFFPLAGVSMDIRSSEKVENDRSFWFYDPEGEIRTFQSDTEISRCRRQFDAEKPHGMWNQVDLICIGSTAYHIVNGKVVMVLENSMDRSTDEPTPLTRGKIQLQSEGAEAFYKNIRIRKITSLPAEISAQIEH